MGREIPIEHMAEALAARIPCPVAGCDGTVRLGLVMIDGGGDLPSWSCDHNYTHQWREDGTPRWEIELVADLDVVIPSGRPTNA